MIKCNAVCILARTQEKRKQAENGTVRSSVSTKGLEIVHILPITSTV